MKDLSGVPLWRRLLALRANIRQGWKGLPGVNTDVKSFITLGSELDVIKLFMVLI